MDDLNEKIEEIIEDIADIWLKIVVIFLFIGLLITAPVWLVPYLVYRAFKQKKEDREHDTSK